MKTIMPSDEQIKRWRRERYESGSSLQEQECIAHKAAEHAAEVMRERCAQVCFDADKSIHPTDLGEAILALPLKEDE